VFVSNAVALGADGSVNTSEVFLHDRRTRMTERVSLRDDGQPVSSRGGFPEVGDQGTVAFTSAATMVAAMPSSFRKVYVRDRGPEVGPAWLTAEAIDDDVHVSGTGLLPAALLAAASTDEIGAGEILSGAELHYRPERADLVARWTTPAMPAARSSARTWFSPALPSVAAGPLLVHGLQTEIEGERFEVRVAQAGVENGPAVPHAALFRCDLTCERVAALSAAWGTAGEEVTAAIPLAVLDVPEGTALTDLEAWVGIGTTMSGAVPVAGLDLDDATIPVRSAALGLGPPAASADDVMFDRRAQLEDGQLTGTVPVEGVPAGHAVWAQVCLGKICGAGPAPSILGAEPSPNTRPRPTPAPEPEATEDYIPQN
jgi:hypothetical protein